MLLLLHFHSGQKFQTSVERVLRIWKERKVYDGQFVKELQLLIGEKRDDNGVWRKKGGRDGNQRGKRERA